MTRFVLLCALLLPLSGCDFFAELFGPNEPPVAPPEPVPVDLPVFTRTLRGDAHDNFATRPLSRHPSTQSRLVVLAPRQLPLQRKGRVRRAKPRRREVVILQVKALHHHARDSLKLRRRIPRRVETADPVVHQ